MKNIIMLTLFVIITGCQTAGEYFGRKKINYAINSNCGGFVNGEYIDTTNWISVSPGDFDYLIEYYEDKEDRLFKCLKFGNCK
jgi:hypothetical protein